MSVHGPGDPATFAVPAIRNINGIAAVAWLNVRVLVGGAAECRHTLDALRSGQPDRANPTGKRWRRVQKRIAESRLFRQNCADSTVIR
jgi:hypothetical protein